MNAASDAPLSPRQHWAAIAQGLQQDQMACEALADLLQQQFHAALRHDAAAMQTLADAISAQVQAMEGSRLQRVAHAKALLPPTATVSMAALFSQLGAPLQQQFQALWDKLEASVQACKAANVRNCTLIMEQAEVMRSVIAGPEQGVIYAPL